MDAEVTAHLLVALAVTITLCRVLGALARRLGQPPVVGEIAGGVLLGSALVFPAVSDLLLPAGVRPAFEQIATVGLALFMLLVGVAARGGGHGATPGAPARRRRTVPVLALGSFGLPMAAGTALGWSLVDRHATPSPLATALVVGAATAVTAFPVLARVVAEQGLAGTRVASLALSVAAVGDLAAWATLALTLAWAGGTSGLGRLLPATVVLVLVAVALRRWLGRLLVARCSPATGALIVAAAALLCAGVAEWGGLHAILGSFVCGAALPDDVVAHLREALRLRVEPVAGLLTPTYFFVAGAGVTLTGPGSGALGELALVLLVAVGAKTAGTYGAARLLATSRASAATLAVLMNLRGITELVLLSVAHQAGLLDQRLYSVLAVMAVVTTLLPGPVLTLLRGPLARDRPTAPPAAPAITETVPRPSPPGRAWRPARPDRPEQPGGPP